MTTNHIDVGLRRDFAKIAFQELMRRVPPGTQVDTGQRIRDAWYLGHHMAANEFTPMVDNAQGSASRNVKPKDGDNKDDESESKNQSSRS